MKTLQLRDISGMNKIACFYNYFSYQPHPKQLEVHLSTARFRTVAAGARAGKSMLGGAEAALFLLLPNIHVWFVSAIFSLADKEFDWMLEFLSRCRLSGKRVVEYANLSNPSRGVRKIRFPWGSWAETKSSANPESLLGEELDLIVVGEASQLPKSAWNRQLRPRLGPRNGGALALSTPNWDGGFLKHMCELGESKDVEFSEYESWQFSVLANPTFSREEYLLAKATLPEKVFKEQYDGEFVSRSGVVFPQFGKNHVVVDLPEESIYWPILIGIHHERNSFNNPLSAVIVCIDPETKKSYIIDEYYESQAMHVNLFFALDEKTKGRRIITIMTDFANFTLQEAIKKKYTSVNVNNEKKYTKKHAIVRRIQMLQTSLLKEEILISSNCKNTISEFTQCKWPTPRKEEVESAESEMPRTKFLNLPLALSYVVAFCKIAQGIDIYSAQGKTSQEKRKMA